ncbi:hypothetical protein RCL1_005726 [Eukaryota sp. TZLM3-RCL]
MPSTSVSILVNNILSERFFQKYRNLDAYFSNLNCRSFCLQRWMTHFQSDVLLLQEFCRKEQSSFFDFSLYHCIFIGSSSNVYPTVLLKKSVFPTFEIISSLNSSINGYIAVKTKHISGFEAIFVSVHCPYGGSENFVECGLDQFLSGVSLPVVIGGDFNKEIVPLSSKNFEVPVPQAHLSNTEQGSFIVKFDHVFISNLNPESVVLNYVTPANLLLTHGWGSGDAKDGEEIVKENADANVFYSDHGIIQFNINLTD